MDRQTTLFAAAVGVAGLIISAALFAFVFATGQTFGQRCTAAGHEGPQHDACVRQMSGRG